MRIPRLHEISIRTQIMLMLGSVAFVTAVGSWVLLNGALPVALERAPGDLSAIIIVLVGIVACATAVMACAAAAFLNASIGRTISSIATAAEEIAAGRFSHRIQSRRADELGELSRTIDSMASRLQQLEQARQQFIASVSHELRTPLTVARGHAFTLARKEHDSERLRRLQLVDSEIERVAELVDDLLRASSMQARPLQVQPRCACIGDVVTAAAERFHERARSAGVAITTEVTTDDTVVEVDVGRVQQLLGNLIDNAIRHADPGTAITVEARGLRRSRVRLSVANQGAPLREQEAREFFEPFVQGASRRGSAGLGLSIASDLARAHGSSLNVACDGPQITFWFELTAVASQRQPAVALARMAT